VNQAIRRRNFVFWLQK